MRVYLAAAYKRRAEIKEVAEQLRALKYGPVPLGIEVTSTWLDKEDTVQCPSSMRHKAYRDILDVLKADTIVRFSDAPELKRDEEWQEGSDSRLVSGARHFEMGFVYGVSSMSRRYKMLVVGGHQNVFDYLDEVTHVADVEELKEKLTSWQVN